MALRKISTAGPRLLLFSSFEIAFCRNPAALAIVACERSPRVFRNAARTVAHFHGIGADRIPDSLT